VAGFLQRSFPHRNTIGSLRRVRHRVGAGAAWPREQRGKGPHFTETRKEHACRKPLVPVRRFASREPSASRLPRRRLATSRSVPTLLGSTVARSERATVTTPFVFVRSSASARSTAFAR